VDAELLVYMHIYARGPEVEDSKWSWKSTSLSRNLVIW